MLSCRKFQKMNVFRQVMSCFPGKQKMWMFVWKQWMNKAKHSSNVHFVQNRLLSSTHRTFWCFSCKMHSNLMFESYNKKIVCQEGFPRRCQKMHVSTSFFKDEFNHFSLLSMISETYRIEYSNGYERSSSHTTNVFFLRESSMAFIYPRTSIFQKNVSFNWCITRNHPVCKLHSFDWKKLAEENERFKMPQVGFRPYFEKSPLGTTFDDIFNLVEWISNFEIPNGERWNILIVDVNCRHFRNPQSTISRRRKFSFFLNHLLHNCV